MIREKQFIDTLEQQEIPYFRSGDNIMVNCPYHPDETQSLGINFYKRVFHCFSCGEVGTPTELFRRLFEEDYEERYEEEVEIGELSEIRKRIRNCGSSNNERDRIKILTNFDLYKYPRPSGRYREYLEGREISLDSCSRFDIRGGFWKGDERILIPMKDEYGRLISIYGRSINTDDQKRKVRKSKNSDVGKILFGLDKVKNRRVILVEGEFDAIYLQQSYFPAISIGSTKPTDIQLYKIGKYFDKVYLSLDGVVVREMRNKIAGMIRGYCNLEIIQLPENKDPNDLTEAELEEVYSKLW